MLENLVDEINEATEILGSTESIADLTKEDEEILREFLRQESNDRDYRQNPKYSFLQNSDSLKRKDPKRFVLGFKDNFPSMGEIMESIYCRIVSHIKEIAYETNITPIEVARKIEGINKALKRILPKRENYELICKLESQMRSELLEDLNSAREENQKYSERIKSIPLIGKVVSYLPNTFLSLKGLPSRELMESVMEDEAAYTQSRADMIYGSRN